MSKKVVFTFGRMNPVTVGHELLVSRVQAVARREHGTPMVFLTHTQDKKKNPISYDDKLHLAREAFGSIVQDSPAKTIIAVMQHLQRSFTDAILVVGGDRVADFEKLLSTYNGKEYNFSSIRVESVGDRDPDADDLSGVSASKARAVAIQGDLDTFTTFLPHKIKHRAEQVMNMVRAGLAKNESYEEEEDMDDMNEHVMSAHERRAHGIAMKRNHYKLEAGIRRSANKMASTDKLKTRARRRAIEILKKIVAGQKGADYANLSTSEKMMIDRMVEKKKSAIASLARKLMSTVRTAEMDRLQQHHTVKEDLDESANAMRNKDGKMRYDRRYKIWKHILPEDVASVKGIVEDVLNETNADVAAFRDQVKDIKTVDSRDSSWMNGLKPLMAKHGFRKLGAGKYASVYGKDGYDYALKVFMKDAAYTRWLSFCLKNRDNPYVPKVRGKVVKITPLIHAIRLEKLSGASSVSGPFGKAYSKWQSDSKYRSGDADIDAILDFFTPNKKLLDLHGDNVMMRGNQLVVIDPFYNWFKPGKGYTIDPDEVDLSVF